MKVVGPRGVPGELDYLLGAGPNKSVGAQGAPGRGCGHSGCGPGGCRCRTEVLLVRTSLAPIGSNLASLLWPQ